MKVFSKYRYYLRYENLLHGFFLLIKIKSEVPVGAVIDLIF